MNMTIEFSRPIIEWQRNKAIQKFPLLCQGPSWIYTAHSAKKQFGFNDGANSYLLRG